MCCRELFLGVLDPQSPQSPQSPRCCALQRAVRVYAVDANKLMKKPDLSKPAKPEKKLFGEEEAQPASTSAASAAGTSAG
jgi:hypothetical protein